VKLKIGDLVADYEVVGTSSPGSSTGAGAGIVYLVRRQGTRRMGCLRSVLAGVERQPEQAMRTLGRLHVLRSLRHPHVASLLSAGVHEDHVYAVVEEAEGKTLSECLGERRMPRSKLVASLMEMLSALEYVHEYGIVHGSLEPRALVLASGGVKVRGWDTAAWVGGRVPASALYAAPEQWRSWMPPDPRWDVHAAGAMLHEVMTGAPPYPAGHPVEVLEARPQALSGGDGLHWVPPALSEVMLLALEKFPEIRLQSALAMMTALGPGLRQLVRQEEQEREAAETVAVGGSRRSARRMETAGEQARRASTRSQSAGATSVALPVQQQTEPVPVPVAEAAASPTATTPAPEPETPAQGNSMRWAVIVVAVAVLIVLALLALRSN
jgi:eukaryotic-like serine/threonine-protein kinase